MAKRILQANAFYAKVGGAEVYMHNLTEALREKGFEVGVFGCSPDADLDEPEVRVLEKPDFDAARLVRDPELSGAFRDFAARFQPDLIHIHNLNSLAADFPLTLGTIGVPVVQTVHEWGQLCPNAWCVLPDGRVCEGGPGAKCMVSGCESNYPYDGRILTAAILRYAIIPKTFQHFLCPSQALADDLTRHGYPNAEGLPLWVDIEGFGEGEEVPVREQDHVLFMGRLVREKGVEYLVRAMPHVLERIPAAKLSIVGGGPELEGLQALAEELGLGASVVFHGKVPHEKVKGYFARASVNVLPSIWCENSPITCYESYDSGLPMVASDIAGLPAMVVDGETGLLARPRDPADLAEKIVRLLTDRELHERTSAGCRAANDRFTRERHMTRILEVYQGLLEGAGAGEAAPATPLASDDVLDVLHRTVEEYCKVERWALDMKKHIDWIESQEKPSVIEKLGRKLRS
jgi:glycosyltransferase involved in cell wall biosynthesis